MPTDLGRVRGSYIFNGTAQNSNDIKTELQNAGKIFLDRDIYICNSIGNHPYFIYNASNSTWEQKGTISGIDNFDTALSSSSTNAPQNKVVKAGIDAVDTRVTNIVNGTTQVGNSKKLNGFNASWTAYAFNPSWSTYGFTYGEGDVYELQVAIGSLNAISAATELINLGIITLPTGSGTVGHEVKTVEFMLNTPSRLQRLCLAFGNYSGLGKSMKLYGYNAGNNLWEERSLGVTFTVFIRKVQDN